MKVAGKPVKSRLAERAALAAARRLHGLVLPEIRWPAQA